MSISDGGEVSGPSDSGSRSTSGDTGEGELVGGVEREDHTTRQCHNSCSNITVETQLSHLSLINTFSHVVQSNID